MGARLGQHFLKSESLLKEIAGAAEISEKDVVLEIGAGDGRFTKELTGAKKVFAVEIDRILFEHLEKLNLPNVEFVNADILDFEIPPDVNKIVGNLPYEISSPVTEKILLFLNNQKRNKVKNLLAVLMYQREFAERMTAFPGLREWSRLSVLVNYYSDCKIVKFIPKTAFRPAPKIESALVKIVPKDVEPDSELLAVAKLLFMHKNKKVINALIDSRQFLKVKEKDKLRDMLQKMLGDLGNKKVFYLEIDEIQGIKEKIKALM
jgi:16S rRNA (adenine1518-N6/adenine1519-N6)-dimethyltransferase